MKMRLILSAAVLGTLILGSCGTSNEVVGGGILQKRKYTKGYNVSWNKNNSGNNSINKEENKIEEDVLGNNHSFIESYENSDVAVISDEITFVSVEKKQSELNEIVLIDTGSSSDLPAVNEVEKNSHKKNTSDFKEKVFKNMETKLSSQKKHAGGDTDQVLIVILCFLLPPLAVYLFEGSWTKRCTVNLILTLLCGLPGVIHALVVVLS